MHLEELRKIYSKKWKKPSRCENSVRYLGYIVPRTPEWHMVQPRKTNEQVKPSVLTCRVVSNENDRRFAKISAREIYDLREESESINSYHPDDALSIDFPSDQNSETGSETAKESDKNETDDNDDGKISWDEGGSDGQAEEAEEEEENDDEDKERDDEDDDDEDERAVRGAVCADEEEENAAGVGQPNMSSAGFYQDDLEDPDKDNCSEVGGDDEVQEEESDGDQDDDESEEHIGLHNEQDGDLDFEVDEIELLDVRMLEDQIDLDIFDDLDLNDDDFYNTDYIDYV